MLEIFSHTLGFAVLFVAAVFDLRTTEVPDAVAIVGLVGGVVLHGLTAYSVGSLEPLVWSLGVGSVFMVFGWGMYYLGIWGGADAFAIGVLGFTAPYSLSGPGVLHPINLFVNVMLVGFGYTLLAASYSALRSSHVLRETYIRIVRDEKKVSAGVLSAAAISALVHTYLGLNGYVYFTLLTGMIFLYYFLKVIENREMKREVEVSELEGGEVIATDLEVEIGEVREENMVGRFLELLSRRENDLFDGLKQSIGYSEVVGVTEQEIERMKELGIQEVEVKKGVMFVPTFPVALLLTDIHGGGLYLLLSALSL